MKVLIACEYSGTVRDAFIRLGHNAMSCDLLPTDVPGPHYQGDVRDILHDGWSDSPDQDKEFIFVQLDYGRLTIQPTNRVRFIDRSFITDTLPKLKLQTEIYSCE